MKITVRMTKTDIKEEVRRVDLMLPELKHQNVEDYFLD